MTLGTAGSELKALSEALESSKPLSILELQGLGKEQWRGIDAVAHVQRERAWWDGSKISVPS